METNHRSEVRITSKGIRKTLNAFTPERAVAEFIWNGFDANATCVEVTCEERKWGNEVLGHPDELIIADNGDGIEFEQLKEKFRPFLESEKAAAKNKKFRESKFQGEEGRGRLTFFKFCHSARWETVYRKSGKNYRYEIRVESDSLDKYASTNPVETELPVGTKVVFSNLHPQITPEYLKTELAEHLLTEFCWFLELNRKEGKRIVLQGKALDWEPQVAERENFPVYHPESKTTFGVRYVRWRDYIPEFSKYYYLTANTEEQFKENTSFNNKGDGFYHSLYIASDYFNEIEPLDERTAGLVEAAPVIEEQTDLFGADRMPYLFLKRQLVEYLRSKRKKVLRIHSEELVDAYETEGVFPRFKANAYDTERKNDLRELIKTLYQAEPRVFQNLNIEQKKTFVRLLNVMMDSDERDSVLKIIEEVLKLEEAEQQELAALLQTTKLNRIIRTIKMIEDRYKAVQLLKDLVFDHEVNANEVNDLQAAIEAHYWLFGEEFHLVTAAEPSFEEALRRLIYTEKGIDEKVKLASPDRLKQMDIFAIREIVHSERLESIVVELKHPKNITLGEKELSQVKGYKSVILSDERFNAKNRTWKFILVGNRCDSYIEHELQNSRMHGEQSLVYSVGNCKIYVKTWSDVFADFECRHNFLTKHLEFEREKLKSQAREKSQVLSALENNSAKASPELVMPEKANKCKRHA